MKLRFIGGAAAAGFVIASAAIAAQQTAAQHTAAQQTQVIGGHLPAPQPGESPICRFVLTDKQGSRPFKLCLTKSQWKVADSRNSKDPNQIECHIEEDITTRLSSYKICQPASAWRQETQDARDFIERVQQSSCVPGGGCPG
jgi:hypothetical protein